MGLSVGAGHASDLAGNIDAGAGPSATFNVTNAPTDATLSNLTLTAGLLTPGFSPGVTSYTRNLVNGVQAVTIVPTTNDPGASIQVDGASLASGATSNPIPVSVGSNTITIQVTAADGGTTQTYTLTLVRAGARNDLLSSLKLSKGALSPVFTGSNTTYNAAVVAGVSALTITPTTFDPNATVAVNGQTITSGTAYPVTLAYGPNVIITTVTAQNDTATRTYTVTVTRTLSANANLASLTINHGSNTPGFAPADTNYTVSVVNGATEMMVTPVTADPTATVTVDGEPATSGTAFGPVALSVGPNVITAVVTAANGTKKTYTVTVTRAASSNDRLLSLKLSRGTLSPVFTPATTSGYTVNVVNGVQSITVTPTAVDASSKLLVNDVTPIASGATSDPIALAVGANTITIKVTAADGTSQDYSVTVTRAAGSTDNYDPGISVTMPTGTPLPGARRYRSTPGHIAQW